MHYQRARLCQRSRAELGCHATRLGTRVKQTKHESSPWSCSCSWSCSCPCSCIMYHVPCIMYRFCRMYHVSCLMYHVSCIMYHVSCSMYHVSCIMYPLVGFGIRDFGIVYQHLWIWFVDLVHSHHLSKPAFVDLDFV